MTDSNQRNPMRRIRAGALLLSACFLLLTAMPASAAIEGRVINSSLNQPSTGDDVVLYRVDRTMREVGRTKSDAKGRFVFEVSSGPKYLVAVFHQKISYHSGVISATHPVEISVYNSVPALGYSTEVSETLFPKVEDNTLKVTEFFVVSNQTMPPRTFTGKQTFSFRLPKDATLDSTAVQPPATLPLYVAAAACGVRGQYCIAYPIRPGTTRIRSVYHLPYSGNVSIATRLLHSVGEVALMIPGALQLDSKFPDNFASSGVRDGVTRYVATNLHPGQSVSFSLVGTGKGLQSDSAIGPVATPRPSRDASGAKSIPTVQSRGLDRFGWIALAGVLGCGLWLILLGRRVASRIVA